MSHGTGWTLFTDRTTTGASGKVPISGGSTIEVVKYGGTLSADLMCQIDADSDSAGAVLTTVTDDSVYTTTATCEEFWTQTNTCTSCRQSVFVRTEKLP